MKEKSSSSLTQLCIHPLNDTTLLNYLQMIAIMIVYKGFSYFFVYNFNGNFNRINYVNLVQITKDIGKVTSIFLL